MTSFVHDYAVYHSLYIVQDDYYRIMERMESTIQAFCLHVGWQNARPRTSTSNNATNFLLPAVFQVKYSGNMTCLRVSLPSTKLGYTFSRRTRFIVAQSYSQQGAGASQQATVPLDQTARVSSLTNKLLHFRSHTINDRSLFSAFLHFTIFLRRHFFHPCDIILGSFLRIVEYF